MAAWLTLERTRVFGANGDDFFHLGLPCNRVLTRAAVTKQVFVDSDKTEAVWGETAAETPDACDTETEEREISPAQYAYEVPVALAHLSPWLSRWAYETFKAAEFDSMYRLRDGADWRTYVEELRAGMKRERGQT